MKRGTGITITYDADGNRVSKTVSGTTTHYLVDDLNPTGYAQVIGEYTGATVTTLVKTYSYGHDLLSQRTAAGTLHFYGYDGLGSVRKLFNSSGTVTDTYVYDAWGKLVTADSTTPTANHYRYTGEQWDADLGMYYLRARYYRAENGRFWTMDSYEGSQSDPQNLHKYLYAHANPVNMTDPSGLFGLFKFTRNFGNAAHAAIESAYQAENPGAIVGPTRGILGPLKPDIFNPIKMTYGEIKPLSLSGVAAGITQLAAYEVMFGVNGYPGLTGLRFNHETWPDGVRGAYVGQIPIAYWNCAGIIFYTDMVDNTEDLLALSTFAAAREFIRANSVSMGRTLAGAMPRIAVLASSRAPVDTARFQMHLGIAALLASFGAL